MNMGKKSTKTVEATKAPEVTPSPVTAETNGEANSETKAEQVRAFRLQLGGESSPTKILRAMVTAGSVAWCRTEEDVQKNVGYVSYIIKQGESKKRQAEETDLDVILARLAIVQEYATEIGGKEQLVARLEESAQISALADKVGGYPNLVKFAGKVK